MSKTLQERLKDYREGKPGTVIPASNLIHVETVDKVRLEQSAFESLCKQLPQPIVTDDTSAHRAGFLLGIQHALKVLKEGFVIG